MRRVYTALLFLLIPPALLRLLFKGLKNPRYLRRMGERFGGGAACGMQKPLWIHAVSVGEARAAMPFIRAFVARGNREILVTTMTPTGAATVAPVAGGVVAHRYMPYDLPFALRRFIARHRPAMLLVMETEIWPNLIHTATALGVPVVFANVRMSQKSRRGYARWRSLFAPALRTTAAFAAQSADDAARMVQLGARPAAVKVTGNVKFDIPLPPGLAEDAAKLRKKWGGGRRVWIAGSTHPGEEDVVLGVFARLKKNHPDLLLLLVPRHPERAPAVARLCKKQSLRAVRRSESTEAGAAVDVCIGDTMGELCMLYAAADVAFVGGSLAPTGGHNVLEPCAAGVPALFGPHMFNFAEISRLVLRNNAGAMVAGAPQLESAVAQLLADPAKRARMGEAGRTLVAANSGALEKTMAFIDRHLPAAV